MVIEFLCPNGHKIRCREERAGQAARCPKCGVKFVIPDAPENQPSEEPAASAPGSSPGISGVRAGPGSRGDSGKDLIEFLCPNGHLLHGSKRLQGHPGQCPECGSKFRIPTYDESIGEQDRAEKGATETRKPQKAEQSAKEPEVQVILEPPDARGDSAVNLSDVHGAFDDTRSPRAGDKLRTALQTNGSGRLQRAREAHPFYEVFCRLWAAKTDSTTIEIQLADGEKLSPWRFGKAMSQGSHAVFAVKDSDGTYTMVAVAWDAVSRVFVRCVRELPQEMRE